MYNVLAGEPVLFLHIFRVTEYTVAGVEVVVRPPKREIKISHYVGPNIIKYNLPRVSSSAASPGEIRYPAADKRTVSNTSLSRTAKQVTPPGGIAGS